MWQQWLNMILGLWVIVLAFIGLTGSALVWTLAVTGIVIAILGIWGALSKPAGNANLRQAY